MVPPSSGLGGGLHPDEIANVTKKHASDAANGAVLVMSPDRAARGSMDAIRTRTSESQGRKKNGRSTIKSGW
jgi:hypothetical protein